MFFFIGSCWIMAVLCCMNDGSATSPTTYYGEARTHIKEYEMAGFPGAVGSTDATHVLLERVSN